MKPKVVFLIACGTVGIITLSALLWNIRPTISSEASDTPTAATPYDPDKLQPKDDPANAPLPFLSRHLFYKDGFYYAATPPGLLQSSLLQLKFKDPKGKTIDITEADRLNGQLASYLITDNPTYREYNGFGSKNQWSPWVTEPFLISVIINKGSLSIWEVLPNVAAQRLSAPNTWILQAFDLLPPTPMQRQPKDDDGSIWKPVCNHPTEISGYIKYLHSSGYSAPRIAIDPKHPIEAIHYNGWGVDDFNVVSNPHGVVLLDKATREPLNSANFLIGEIRIFKGEFDQYLNDPDVSFLVDREIVDADAAFTPANLAPESDADLRRDIVGTWSARNTLTFRPDGKWELRNSRALNEPPEAGIFTWSIDHDTLILLNNGQIYRDTITTINTTQLGLQYSDGGDVEVFARIDLQK